MNETIGKVEFQEGEEVKYKGEGIPLKISSNQTDNFVIFKEGVICITNQRIVFANVESKIFQLEYQNVISHGIQDSNLVCYLTGGNDNNDNDEEEYDDEDEKAYFTFLQNTNNEVINLQGDFEVRFSFETNPAADINSAFNFFSECSALNPDGEDDGSHVANLMGGMPGFGDFDFESMVTAKDIDENGNLIPKQLGNQQDGDQNEDDDEEEEYTDDEGEEQQVDQNNNVNSDQNQQGTEGNGDKMDLE